MSKEDGIGLPSLPGGTPWVIALVAVAAMATRAPAPAVPQAPPAIEAGVEGTSKPAASRDLGAVIPIVKLIADAANVQLTPPDVGESWETVERYLHGKCEESVKVSKRPHPGPCEAPKPRYGDATSGTQSPRSPAAPLKAGQQPPSSDV